MMTRVTKQDSWGEPVNLGVAVNSALGEWCPRLSPDGLSLYFHSQRGGGQGGSDIWMTKRAALDAPWQAPVNLGKKINTTDGELDPSISADGLTLYFDRDEATIYEATRSSVDAPWDNAEVVISSLNGPTDDYYPYISNDGLSLYFCSDRPSGFGSMDIYVVTRPSLQSPWGEPVNLGDAINTPYYNCAPCVSVDGLTLYYDESGGIRIATRMSLSEPFAQPVSLTSNDMWAQLSSDGLTMYFASDRPGGCGYQDIWMATRSSPRDPWQDPVNLGPAVNSNDWDWAPCVSANGLELYFASEHDCNDSDWDLWVSTRPTTDAPWGPAVNMGTVVNSGSPNGNCTISGDGLTLVFSSERTGGTGSGDLWMTRRSALAEPWGQPVNLDAPVNTIRYEAAPCLSADGRWLFFTSVSPTSPATYNHIMLSALGPDGKWGTPRNLAHETALPANAGGPAISPDGHTLYFGSDVPDGVGGYDIWSLDVLPVLDLNGDGRVDEFETSLVEAHLGEDKPSCDVAPSPLGDGIVDGQDLDVFLARLGEDVNDPMLLAHWALDETEGETAYDGANHYDGTLHGGPLWQPTDGTIDGALLFDGVDDCVSTDFILNPSLGSFSVFAWVRGERPGQVILSQARGTDWLLAAPVTGTLMSDLKFPIGGKVLSSQTVITDGTWHRVGFVRDGTNRMLYVDDVEVAKDTQSTLPGAGGGMYMGAGSKLSDGTFWSGLIDEVRVYNRVVRP